MSYRPHHPEIATPSPTEPRASTLHTPHANKRKTESSDDPPEKWRRMFNTAPRQGGTPESTKKFTAESARSCSELFQGNGTSTKVNPDVIPGLENKWRFAHNDAKARAEGLLRAWASKAEAEEESIQRARKEESTRLSEKHKADMSKFESRQDMEQRHKREHEELQVSLTLASTFETVQVSIREAYRYMLLTALRLRKSRTKSCRCAQTRKQL